MSSTTGEVLAVECERGDTPPDSMARSIVFRGANAELGEVVARVRAAWTTIASWGRWMDEELGTWPEAESCMAQLPAWLSGALRAAPAGEVDNWLDDIHDRNWRWWSCEIRGSVAKLDLLVESAPGSIWPLEFVIGAAGGRIVHRDEWISFATIPNSDK